MEQDGYKYLLNQTLDDEKKKSGREILKIMSDMANGIDNCFYRQKQT